jgi:hypothetical protein
MEDNYPFQDEIKEMNKTRQTFKEELRKKKINEKLMESRMPSKKNLSKLKEEEKEEPRKSEEMHLQLNQFHKYYRSKKKGKRCWLCRSWRHLKCNCPKLRCWFCGNKGHTKRKCYKYELHLAIQILRNTHGDKEMKEKRNKNTALDRFKEVEFRLVNGEMIMNHKGTDLAVYIGEYKFSYAKRGFESSLLPKWLMEKPITTDIPIKKLKYSNYLPHQCGIDGEVIDGFNFGVHCDTKHRGYCPKGSLINASPYRYWLLWFDDRNFGRFMNTIGDPQYIKAPPPWVS